MFERISTFIGFAFLATFWIGVFFVGRAVWRAGRSQRYVRCAGFSLLVAALLWAGIFVGLTPGATAYARYRYTEKLFGRRFALGSPRHAYYSEQDFHGDGYSIEVFAISDALTRWAASPPPEFSTIYPVIPSVRSEWSAIRWRRTPVSASERKLLEFALTESAVSEDLTIAIRLLDRLANEPGHYFACFYKMYGDRVENVDFFLLSPSERVLIRVNHNT